MMNDARTPTIVFAGDSVTDCGRLSDPRGLGDGYVQRLADAPGLAGVPVINRGISGDRVRDLWARWEGDVIAEAPDAVSIMIGINDVWRRYDNNDPTTTEQFASTYREILSSLARHQIPAIVVEPFVLPVTDEQLRWHEDLSPKIDALSRLAHEFAATLVPMHSALTALAADRGAATLAPDGVHPSSLGHDAIAQIWLDYTRGSFDAATW